jgi:drug/metabolite transporter (DMT)-like permease
MSADKPIDSRRLTLIQLATVALVFFAASLFVGDGVADTVGRLTPQGWIELAYLALACTVLAFCVQMWAVRRTSPARVGLLLGTEPMWAAAVGIALAGDRLTPVSATGAALILLATTTQSTPKHRHSRVPPQEPHPNDFTPIATDTERRRVHGCCLSGGG